MRQVRVLPGVWKDTMELNRTFLQSIPNDQLLHNLLYPRSDRLLCRSCGLSSVISTIAPLRLTELRVRGFMRMTRFIGEAALAVLTVTCLSAIAYGQSPKQLYDQHRWFELRELVKSTEAPPLYSEHASTGLRGSADRLLGVLIALL
jgi:hypothetical protein